MRHSSPTASLQSSSSLATINSSTALSYGEGEESLHNSAINVSLFSFPESGDDQPSLPLSFAERFLDTRLLRWMTSKNRSSIEGPPQPRDENRQGASSSPPLDVEHDAEPQRRNARRSVDEVEYVATAPPSSLADAKSKSLRETPALKASSSSPVLRDKGNCQPSEDPKDGRSSSSPPFFTSSPASAAPQSGFPRSERVLLSMDRVGLVKRRLRWFRRRKVLTYLKECSLYIPPGSFHCIASITPLYASAAMAVLAGVEEAATMNGMARANELSTTSPQYRQRIAHVASLDYCNEDLSVEENIKFAIRIRLSTTKAAMMAIVNDTAEQTLLSELMDAKVSTLSPSHRYLLAVAMELVTMPLVLLLDRPLFYFPLSQLHLLLRCIRNLQCRDPSRTIVLASTSIPWPLFDELDSVTLLTSEGRVFFTGEKRYIEQFLQEDLAILCVPGEAVIDILTQMEEDKASISNAAISFSRSIYNAKLQRCINTHRTRVAEDSFPPIAPPPLGRSSQYQQSIQSALFMYSLQRNFFLRSSLLPWVGMLVLLPLLCIVAPLVESGTQGDMQNVCGVIFLLLSCSIQINYIFVDSELQVCSAFLGLRNKVGVSILPFFLVTLLRVLLPRLLFFVAGTIYSFAVFHTFIVGQMCFSIALTSFIYAGLMQLLIYQFHDTGRVSMVQHLYYVYCVIFSGYLLSLSSVPAVVQYLSLLRIGYGGLVESVLKGKRYGCDNVTNTTIILDNGSDDYGCLGNSDSSSSSSAAGASSCFSNSTSDVTATSRFCYTGDQFLELQGLGNLSWEVSASFLSLILVVVLAAVAICMRFWGRVHRIG